MLTREDDIDVHALRRQGWTISAIARHLGSVPVTPPTTAAASGHPPSPYIRTPVFGT